MLLPGLGLILGLGPEKGAGTSPGGGSCDAIACVIVAPYLQRFPASVASDVACPKISILSDSLVQKLLIDSVKRNL